jgi:hypothetical protein
VGTSLVSQCFDMPFTDLETGTPLAAQGFHLALPYSPGVAQVVLNQATLPIDVRAVSLASPLVTVLAPNGGEQWPVAGPQTIAWTASDTDSTELQFTVLYSPDGSQWVPLRAGLSETELTVQAADLPGGATARIRVLATDGVNTAEDLSDGAFSVGSKGPGALILSPQAGSVGASQLWLQGYGFDLEDGVLPPSNLQWSSHRDGLLGTGSLVLATLSRGLHTLSLVATDSDGQAASTSVTIQVGSLTYLPVTRR